MATADGRIDRDLFIAFFNVFMAYFLRWQMRSALLLPI
jgi:hypothetical protein